MLKQFVRNRDGQKVGVMVADSFDGQVCVGFSFARKGKTNMYNVFDAQGQFICVISEDKCGDEFDQKIGEDIAYGRMMTGSNVTAPGRYRYDVIGFIQRANQYFQGDTPASFEFVDGLVSVCNNVGVNA